MFWICLIAVSAKNYCPVTPSTLCSRDVVAGQYVVDCEALKVCPETLPKLNPVTRLRENMPSFDFRPRMTDLEIIQKILNLILSGISIAAARMLIKMYYPWLIC